jgi:hypothetical protein
MSCSLVFRWKMRIRACSLAILKLPRSDKELLLSSTNISYINGYLPRAIP